MWHIQKRRTDFSISQYARQEKKRDGKTVRRMPRSHLRPMIFGRICAFSQKAKPIHGTQTLSLFLRLPQKGIVTSRARQDRFNVLLCQRPKSEKSKMQRTKEDALQCPHLPHMLLEVYIKVIAALLQLSYCDDYKTRLRDRAPSHPAMSADAFQLYEMTASMGQAAIPGSWHGAIMNQNTS